MPSNPVDEARLRVMHWAIMSDAALLEMGVDRQDEVFHAVNALIAESDRRAIQQERSRYEGLLREIIEASEEWVIEDAPPIRLARAIGRAAAALTPSAPAEKEG